MNKNEKIVHEILEKWATNTRQDNRDKILENHDKDVLIYDVLAPLFYKSAESYKATWDEWQPQTQGENTFDLQDVVVQAGDTTAFAHCLIHCGGTLEDGKTFEDLVRATFCFSLQDSAWKIVHQHISKPINI